MYRIVPDDEVLAQVAELPVEALAEFADLLETLTVTPWNGDPQHADNPDGPVRRWHFGPGQAGQLVYLILEERDEVHPLLVQWLG
ncbi:hypothetical protein [Amycolatopsis sp. NPDC059657]|uniref:hypothetical protein n=1 Tax=Amycolatopsis sp. NPDC059657 TaxID=3346899 RepID=UPI00366E26A3